MLSAQTCHAEAFVLLLCLQLPHSGAKRRQLPLMLRLQEAELKARLVLHYSLASDPAIMHYD